MSACRGCGQQQICSCAFASACSDVNCATLTGSGRSYAPYNFRPNNVPLPRPYGFTRRIGLNQVIAASSVNVPINFDNVSANPFSGGMASSAQPDRLTVPISGYYLIQAYVNTDTPAAVGNDILHILINGVTVLASQIGAVEGSKSIVLLDDLTIGDYIQAALSTPAGGNTTTLQSDATFGFASAIPFLWAQWMRDL